jgi:hypothetical protein
MMHGLVKVKVVPVLNWLSTTSCRHMGSRCIDPLFLTSALLVHEWPASRPGPFTPRERAPSTLWLGGWVGPRACLENVVEWKFLTLLGLEHQPLSCPTHSQALGLKKYGHQPTSGNPSIMADDLFATWHSWIKVLGLGFHLANKKW